MSARMASGASFGAKRLSPAIPVDQKFREIPFDRLRSEQAGASFFKCA